MNLRAILAVGLAIGASAPCGASATPPGRIYGDAHLPALIEKASCDIRNEDKQAKCVQACDDTWIKATQAYNANIDQAKGEKKSCEAKCGC